jgi:hypothetical protein
MANGSNPFGSSTGKAAGETILAFLAALLVIPLLFKTVGALFRLGFVRKLLAETAIVGATALLTNDDVLNKVFGQKGQRGDGLIKPDVPPKA